MSKKMKQIMASVLAVVFMFSITTSNVNAETNEDGWTVHKSKGIVGTILGVFFDCFSDYRVVYSDAKTHYLRCKGAGDKLCVVPPDAAGSGNLSAKQINDLSKELDVYVSEQVAMGVLTGSHNSNILITKEGTDMLIPVYRRVDWNVVKTSDTTHQIDIKTHITEKP